jgi:pyruvate/2-oxoglutarate dehydrogenase complex dihydrolipoamide acyltransferase (E2) component
MGMFTSGASVGVPITPMTLSLCIGSIEKKLALLDGQVIEREVLHFNISIDHDIIDGAPLVRFAERFKKILLDGRALPARTAEPVRSLRDRLDVSERRADDDSSKATVRS